MSECRICKKSVRRFIVNDLYDLDICSNSCFQKLSLEDAECYSRSMNALYQHRLNVIYSKTKTATLNKGNNIIQLDEFISTNEAARMLRLSNTTIRNFILEGKIIAYQLKNKSFLIKKEDFDYFISWYKRSK